MSTVSRFPERKAPTRPTQAAASPDAISYAIKVLLADLSPEDREKVVGDLAALVQPIPVNRGGDVLGAIVRLLPRSKEWTVDDLKEAVKSAGIAAKPKEVYNAIGYLTRRGHMKRVGYGRYVVDGVEIVTADDLGGPPSRHEDGYRLDREEPK